MLISCVVLSAWQKCFYCCLFSEIAADLHIQRCFASTAGRAESRYTGRCVKQGLEPGFLAEETLKQGF